MNCREFEARLDWVLDRRLPPDRDRLLRAHALICSHCCETLDLSLDIATALPAPTRPDEFSADSASHANRVVDRFRQETRLKQNRLQPAAWVRRWTTGLTTALTAGAAVAIFFALIALQPPPRTLPGGAAVKSSPPSGSQKKPNRIGFSAMMARGRPAPRENPANPPTLAPSRPAPSQQLSSRPAQISSPKSALPDAEPVELLGAVLGQLPPSLQAPLIRAGWPQRLVAQGPDFPLDGLADGFRPLADSLAAAIDLLLDRAVPRSLDSVRQRHRCPAPPFDPNLDQALRLPSGEVVA